MKSLKKHSRAILLFSFLVGWACVNPEEWSVTSASTHTLPYLNMNVELLNKPVTFFPVHKVLRDLQSFHFVFKITISEMRVML